jgi:hypothetical protein
MIDGWEDGLVTWRLIVLLDKTVDEWRACT